RGGFAAHAVGREPAWSWTAGDWLEPRLDRSLSRHEHGHPGRNAWDALGIGCFRAPWRVGPEIPREHDGAPQDGRPTRIVWQGFEAQALGQQHLDHVAGPP